MARKRFDTLEDDSPADLAVEETPAPAPEPKPTAPKPAAKSALTVFQIAVAAIADRRANDSYKLTNNLDMVQYRSSTGRLVASANKKVIKVDKRTGQYETDTAGALALASAALARYKDFSESKVIASNQVGSIVFVVTIDGEKYRYDLTANALAS